MNGVAGDLLTDSAAKVSAEPSDRESEAKGGDVFACGSSAAAAEPSGTQASDLRWLGMMSCMGSALITLVGAVLITGHLLSSGAGGIVAEDEGAPPGYAVAAGSDR